jgi:hypothetical protein
MKVTLLFYKLGFGHLLVLFRFDGFWNQFSDFSLQLGFHRRRVNVVFSFHKGLVSLSRHFLRVICVLPGGAKLCIVQTGSMKEICIRGAGLQCGDGYACPFQFAPQ